MHLEDYVRLDAVGLAEAIRIGRTSSAEAVELAQEAVRRVNGELNCVVEVADPAPECASDSRLAGVPYLLKDLGHNWAGFSSTMGSRIGAGFRFTEDGPLAQRLRKAGLRPIATTNSSEFGVNGVTEPLAHGPTLNPWDKHMSPGGSSGGSAAAVAAGIVPMAHASDGGGSIRVPAAWCGLVGLKPSRGRVPLGSLADSDGNSWITAQLAVSRTLRDTAAILDIASGPCPGDYVPLAPKPCFLDAVATPPRKLRVAVCTRFDGAPVTDPDCETAAMAAGEHCARLGHGVTHVAPSIGYDDMASVCFDLFAPAMKGEIDAVARATGLPADHTTLEPQTIATIRYGEAMSAETLIDRLNRATAMSRIMGAFMEDYDVLITPTTSRTSCRIGEFSGTRYPDDNVSFWYEEMATYAFCPLFSITGQPAMTLPLHHADSGFPVGVQLTAATGNDAVLFQLGGQLESIAPWIERRPAIHVLDLGGR